MPIEVLPLKPADIPSAVSCIQQAFEHDPYNNWVFDKAHFSRKRNSVSLSLRCQWGMHHALFTVAKDSSDPTSSRVLGVACWLPPVDASEPRTWRAWAGDWWLWLAQVRMNLVHGRGGLRVERYWIWKAAQAEAQREIWTDPEGYYFCNIVVVLPEWQGKGIGRMLVDDVARQADGRGRKCYLESSRWDPNGAIYERLGFRLVREMVCDSDGDAVKLYCMVREPVTDADIT